MIKNKVIALISHDARKVDMMEWVKYNVKTLQKNKLVCTGTTGGLVEKVIKEYAEKHDIDSIEIIKKKSGPMGGDAQMKNLKLKVLIWWHSRNNHNCDCCCSCIRL